MADLTDKTARQFPELIEEVDALAEQVKDLALNLALYLARARAGSGGGMVTRLEPQFIRLVNGTVRVVRELTRVLDTARNMQQGTYQIPSGRYDPDYLEVRLKLILDQCANVLTALSQHGIKP
ncbi:MAG: hypothetical protein D6800_01910 [Candidatus Zixiibacteriota bacterium]|nr:MAG: hypothetical protein D6800_01910 [candidate division Zixibacteria bacterium]